MNTSPSPSPSLSPSLSTSQLTSQPRHAAPTPREGTAHLAPARTPLVLFLCIHNAGRSQIAAGYMRALAQGRVRVRSAGSAPAASINPVAVDAMAEEGIDISHAIPELLTEELVQGVDVVVTMGCGDMCPCVPGTRYLDWELDDPAGQSIAAVRVIRDEIRRRVEGLLTDLV